MQVIIEDRLYKGTAAEILDQLRVFNFDPDECPDVDTYILWLQARFITMTSRACDLPAGETTLLCAVFSDAGDLPPASVPQEVKDLAESL